MSSKIQIAVDIIDTLSLKIKDLNITENKDDDYSFSKEIIEEINTEYQKLISQKEPIINLVKDFQKNLIIKLDDIKLPKLENILPSKSSSNINILRCDSCNVFTTDTIKRLSAHKRWCRPPQIPIPINEVDDYLDPWVEPNVSDSPPITVVVSNKKQSKSKLKEKNQNT